MITSEQAKGRIKNIAKTNNADARVLIRIFMMERFLERLSFSKYKENFIIKGGILVASMIGISKRSTMDIDATIQNQNLSEEDVKRIVSEVTEVSLDDGVEFVLKDVYHIMDNLEYPGIRVTIDALFGKMVTPIKLDISTGDVITPRAMEYQYRLMLEDRSIQLLSYNLETILAEKMEAILSKGRLNTRMRDFYDIYTLLLYKKVDYDTLKSAFFATCSKRHSLMLTENAIQRLEDISKDINIEDLWSAYQKKYSYAEGITYSNVMDSVKQLFSIVLTK